jgi:hypothetical protein
MGAPYQAAGGAGEGGSEGRALTPTPPEAGSHGAAPSVARAGSAPARHPVSKRWNAKPPPVASADKGSAQAHNLSAFGNAMNVPPHV